MLLCTDSAVLQSCRECSTVTGDILQWHAEDSQLLYLSTRLLNGNLFHGKAHIHTQAHTDMHTDTDGHAHTDMHTDGHTDTDMHTHGHR